MELTKLSDPELYARCKDYGSLALHWRGKFAGLLPEVARRGLHRRRGYESIHEFAAKLGGMSERAVDKILYLSRTLEDKPVLRGMLESGEAGWAKIEKVAFIADSKTDAFWADKVKNIPTLALAEYVKEKRGDFTKAPNILQLTDVGQSKHELVVSQAPKNMTFPLTVETEIKLRLFKFKLEKKRKIAMTYNEIFKELLDGKACDKCVKHP
jgi:energy-coupling factor transporter ATP-binding protein EcfA2